MSNTSDYYQKVEYVLGKGVNQDYPLLPSNNFCNLIIGASTQSDKTAAAGKVPAIEAIKNIAYNK